MPDTEPLEEDKRCTLFDGKRRFCVRCSEFHKLDDWAEWCEPYFGSAPIRRCKTCGGDHPLDRWPGNCMPERNWLESDLPVCRNFISDNLEAIGGLNGIQCQASGIWFTSKKKLRNEYRARGMIEVGNEPQRFDTVKKPKADKKAIRDAVRRAAWQVEHEGATAENFRSRSKRKPSMFGPQNVRPGR